MEVKWMSLVFKHKDVFALRGAELVIVHPVVFIGVGKFFSSCRAVICAVIESVAFPVGSGELRPFNMVGQ